MSQLAKSRNYTFTINNWNSKDTDKLFKLSKDAGVRCIMYGKEVGKKEGTPHLQGFVVFKTQRRPNAVRKLIRGHVEIMKGRIEQNVTYCSKEGDITIHGKIPMSGKEKGKKEKERWESNLALAKSGRMEDMDADIQIRYYSTIKRIAADYAAPLEPMDTLDNEWIYGPTGTGKSRSVAERYPGAYWKLLNKWWDGYSGQEVVVMEDMDPFNVKLGGDIKRWADHYPFRAEFKGGSKMIRPKKIIITSNYHPSMIWEDRNTVDPILRRFKLKEVGPPPPAISPIFNKP